MNYCSECGLKVEFRIPEGDNLPRFICVNCNTIHYSNPKIVAGCIAEWQGKILLCKRAIEPRYGLWTLPAGFMENRETMPQAAARETLEEANGRVENLRLYALYNLPHISQVYAMYRGDLSRGEASAGLESLEVGLYQEDEIPWDSLAFPVIQESLELYFQDCRHGIFPVRTGDIIRTDGRIEIIRHTA